MARGFFNVPKAVNEPVKEYAPGSPEREEVLATYKEMFHSNIDVPMHINGEEVRTGNTKNITPPHDHQHVVGQYHTADKSHVDAAISTALAAREAWSNVSWTERATIFLKAAELLAGPYRAKMNAATMIAQSKNVYQAEIDAACEMIDFFRFNVQYMTDIFKDQPASAPGIWNRVEYRPLEGFVYAISPFNFTSIAANLPAAAALMGNVVVWKPSDHQAYSAQVIVDLFKEAGLPDGVINVIYGDPVMISDTVLASPDFSGLHFTGSTHVFKNLWKQIGNNIHTYKTYPRIVGETGGKDFVWVHNSSNSLQVATAITRGAFEYQGQKCSAASRAYIPASMWEDVKEHLITQAKEIKMGSPEDPSNFVNAVIHEGSFDKIAHFIDAAKADKDADVIIGGGHDKSVGYFIEPTVIVAKSPTYATMTTELFGPVMTIFVYEDAEWEASLKLVDESTEFALTGAIFSTDRYIVEKASKALENAAGNFYINDKPTGAVVGQQPFGGGRASGTNDKAGSAQNLLRWTSVRLIKETLVTPTDYKYAFLG
ncbi:L-glutamate gamma-semialdehyde dehydrogenase [Polaribacter sp.]|jgi:1-pyrroline-5-carboxylate dehydrogenase|uniref:L-glutamate gamma-semialdehyde dehydrogenase n=1 Tax=Wenyingzhuangia sp. TaxID=1964193 RepID=UPI002339493B|nr:L-glutamate gamma-semialdehyde dehydrogenase [Polaribacter sp.]MDB4209609.1 L-glutamate gamma-semialdehyde dehydrogenase [Polaribacter sp.]MDB9777574.1 L-glutamate gamma-semialdehyde dehydrogenase [Polaribacter sp.]MDB9888247.1 L-glutamate gamma-semialdehyde dehydrogenase [Polaribacter sp.]MDC1354508.1 L-glutamate gamma-semialdehyde dehydrogenase [Polaribacter sp.]